MNKRGKKNIRFLVNGIPFMLKNFINKNEPSMSGEEVSKTIKKFIWKCVTAHEKNEVNKLRLSNEENEIHCELEKFFNWLPFEEQKKIFIEILKRILEEYNRKYEFCNIPKKQKEYSACIKFLKEEIEFFESLIAPKKTLTQRTGKPFPEYLDHDKQEQLADALKKKFNTGKGKIIFLMLKALEEREKFSFVNGEKKDVYESMKIFFNSVGSRPGIFNFKYIPEKHEADYKATLAKIDSILSTLEKQ